MAEKKFRQICHCEKCGNEAEMIVTCELAPDIDETELEKKDLRASNEKMEGGVQGHAVCSHCGSEADIWLDIGE
ncbi:MAG TPA: hypothetical protein VJ879_02340 [Desulfobacter sp.]|nr:hypothetical protein [Desulfobacterales bacterium]HKL81328.1 hypothetical protein [Desulfobacter sp.]